MNRDPFNRLKLVFTGNNVLDSNQAPASLTPDDVMFSETIDEVKNQLISIVLKEAQKCLTDHQLRVFDARQDGKTILETAYSIDYTGKPTTGYSNVWNALYGINHKNGNTRGGVYRKLNKSLIDNKKVTRLLNMFDYAQRRDYKRCLTFLRKADPFWEQWSNESYEDNETNL